jgi:DNA-binding NarL/FixJ family response regulator
MTPPRLEALVENVPGNVYRRVRRPDGSYHFAYLSSGLFRYFGVDNERLLGEERLRFDWIHPDDKERFTSDLALSAATLGMLDHRIRVVGQDGQVHWARGIARPERMPDGSVVWDGIVIDVTREVEAEAALRITKDEAERANKKTVEIVAAVAAKLRQPIEELESLLAAFGDSPAMGDALRESLQSCIDALQMVAEGSAMQSPATERAAVQTRRVEALGAAALTGRQREVMALMAKGRSNKEIAQQLGIAPGTVRLHVAAVLKAMRAKSRKALVQG